jgi:hypothetical protein
MIRQLSIGTAVLLGVLSLANGSYMLIDPANWYFAIPGVTTTGPFNQHFLRDIGIVFLFLGLAFLAGVRWPGSRVVLWGGATLWLCGHALFHLWEVAAGICGPDALVRDFAAVSLPAILGILITGWAIADARARATSQGD